LVTGGFPNAIRDIPPVQGLRNLLHQGEGGIDAVIKSGGDMIGLEVKFGKVRAEKRVLGRMKRVYVLSKDEVGDNVIPVSNILGDARRPPDHRTESADLTYRPKNNSNQSIFTLLLLFPSFVPPSPPHLFLESLRVTSAIFGPLNYVFTNRY